MNIGEVKKTISGATKMIFDAHKILAKNYLESCCRVDGVVEELSDVIAEYLTHCSKRKLIEVIEGSIKLGPDATCADVVEMMEKMQ